MHQILCQSWEKCYGDQILSGAQVFQWCAWLKTGRTSVDDTNTQEEIQAAHLLKLLHELKSSSVRIDVREVRTGYGTCQRVLTKELGMHRVAAKFVPRILTSDPKQQQFLAKHKMAVIPHTPYPPFWHPVTSTYFQK
jgi:hypothetical protein